MAPSSLAHRLPAGFYEPAFLDGDPARLFFVHQDDGRVGVIDPDLEARLFNQAAPVPDAGDGSQAAARLVLLELRLSERRAEPQDAGDLARVAAVSSVFVRAPLRAGGFVDVEALAEALAGRPRDLEWCPTSTEAERILAAQLAVLLDLAEHVFIGTGERAARLALDS